MKLGIPCGASPDAHNAWQVCSVLRPGDAVVAISYSGATRDTLRAVEIAKEAGAQVVALTRFGRTPLSQLGDAVLHTSSPESRYRAEGYYSRIAQLCIIDALFVGVYLTNENRFLRALSRRELAHRYAAVARGVWSKRIRGWGGAQWTKPNLGEHVERDSFMHNDEEVVLSMRRNVVALLCALTLLLTTVSGVVFAQASNELVVYSTIFAGYAEAMKREFEAREPRRHGACHQSGRHRGDAGPPHGGAQQSACRRDALGRLDGVRLRESSRTAGSGRAG